MSLELLFQNGGHRYWKIEKRTATPTEHLYKNMKNLMLYSQKVRNRWILGNTPHGMSWKQMTYLLINLKYNQSQNKHSYRVMISVKMHFYRISVIEMSWNKMWWRLFWKGMWELIKPAIKLKFERLQKIALGSKISSFYR